MNRYLLKNFSRILSYGITIALVLYILLNNYTPFEIKRTYISGVNKEISEFSPKDRVLVINTDEGVITKQISDLVYFTTRMPLRFDNATIKITFKNPYPNQELHLGFQDQTDWHYNTKLIYTPILDGIDWTEVGEDPKLYQRIPKYSLVEQFLNNPPQEQIVGIYNFDKNLLVNNILDNYVAQNSETIIDIPLRGKHVFYAFVKGEPFRMTIDKQDLNWYENPDIVNIKIYKDRDLVYSAQIDDDGVIDASKKVLPSQQVTIRNPGPELPEPGVYKVVLDASPDTIIKKITTNLHKIVFEGPIFPAANNSVYPAIVEKTTPVKLWTDALVISARTPHEVAFQDIKVGKSMIKLNTKTEVATATAEAITEIEIPKSDIILNGLLGYFSFSRNGFFKPSKYKLITLTEKEDLKVVDYILTSYGKSKTNGEWQVAEYKYDLSNAVIKDNKLSWIVKAPGLKFNGREILIKKIEVKFSKKSLIDS